MINRFPTKLNSLSHLKLFLNHEINTIIDVGILTSTLELIRVFKDQKHVLIEPLEEYHNTIEKNYSDASIDYTLLKLAASNQSGDQQLQKKNHLPALGQKHGGVTASDLVFSDTQTSETLTTVTVNTETLDNIKKNSEGPFLIKIDVDGAEFEILEGLSDVADVFVIVVESWLPRISKFQAVLEAKGFSLYDITDLCYMRGQLSQVDLVFVNRALFNNDRYPEISPRAFGHTPAVPGNYVGFKEDGLEKKIDTFQSIAKLGNID